MLARGQGSSSLGNKRILWSHSELASGTSRLCHLGELNCFLCLLGSLCINPGNTFLPWFLWGVGVGIFNICLYDYTIVAAQYRVVLLTLFLHQPSARRVALRAKTEGGACVSLFLRGELETLKLGMLRPDVWLHKTAVIITKEDLEEARRRNEERK